MLLTPKLPIDYVKMFLVDISEKSTIEEKEEIDCTHGIEKNRNGF